MELLPILPDLSLNGSFINNPDCGESLQMSVDYYKRIGYNPPWICYYVSLRDSLVGTAAFKGRPKEGKVEIAYGTFPRYRHKGIGTDICKELIALAQNTDASVLVTARTLAEPNFSTRILQKNGFIFAGTVNDDEDGEVWEWELK